MKIKTTTIPGERFTRLTVLNCVEHPIYQMKCDCGKVVRKRIHDVKSGRIKSCGCLKREKTIQRNTATAKFNGLSHTPTGVSWGAMMSRCFNKNISTYAAYGASGITVCEFIRASPLNLVLLIGLRPDGKTLDRETNSGNYTCGQCSECFTKGWLMNVRWATPTQQGRNQRTNRIVTIGGISRCVSEWAEISGINSDVIRNRINRGWVGDSILSKPGTFRNNPGLVEICGVSKTKTEWCRIHNIPPSTLHNRIKRGWSGEKLISEQMPQGSWSKKCHTP